VIAIAVTAAGETRPSAKPLATVHATVNLNRASQAELQLLPGIGPALAGRIVAERGSGGGYRDVDDLARVSGVGERTVLKLREFASVGD
jgi:competence protein ComEA